MIESRDRILPVIKPGAIEIVSYVAPQTTWMARTVLPPSLPQAQLHVVDDNEVLSRVKTDTRKRYQGSRYKQDQIDDFVETELNLKRAYLRQHGTDHGAIRHIEARIRSLEKQLRKAKKPDDIKRLQKELNEANTNLAAKNTQHENLYNF